eukprot:c3919_g1_i1.p1 GENE.c3919_g1_i1~~c3919_g1_i1.p1  ORF type:complete len:245 (+),score=55.25 c3919_g1_i1:67-801(+)
MVRRSRTHSKKKRSSFSPHILKVLKQVHPDTGLWKPAMRIMNSIVKDVFVRLMQLAVELQESTTKATLCSRCVQTAVRLLLPGELAKHAVSEGTKAVTKFFSSGTKGNKSRRAGLVFPVGRLKTMMKAFAKTRIGSGAPVYLAAVLEYISAEVLELSGNAARDNKKRRISARHIFLAVSNDEELMRLFRHATIPHGGVLPNIHAALLPKKEFQAPPVFAPAKIKKVKPKAAKKMAKPLVKTPKT